MNQGLRTIAASYLFNAFFAGCKMSFKREVELKSPVPGTNFDGLESVESSGNLQGQFVKLTDEQVPCLGAEGIIEEGMQDTPTSAGDDTEKLSTPKDSEREVDDNWQWRAVVDSTIFRQYTTNRLGASPPSYTILDIDDGPTPEPERIEAKVDDKKRSRCCEKRSWLGKEGQKKDETKGCPEKRGLDENKLEQFLSQDNYRMPSHGRLLYRIIFCDDISIRGLKALRKAYGLEVSDLWKAVKRINTPAVFTSGEERKYLELWTIWKAKTTRNTEKGLSPAIWRPRPIGIFFSKGRVGTNKWLFIVLVAPLSVKDDPALKPLPSPSPVHTAIRSALFKGKPTNEESNEFKLCCRKNDDKNDEPYKWEGTEFNNRSLISYIESGLRQFGPQFLDRILIDVFWGWERYLSAARNDIRAVMVRPWLWQEQLDGGVCWRFFKYKLALTDTRVRFLRDKVFLERYTKSRHTAQWSFPERVDPHKYIQRISALLKDFKSVEPSLQEITNMAYSMTSINESHNASQSNHNMEYLAFLATIFLPLSLVTSIFGMNIMDATHEGKVHWWVPLIMGVSLTLGVLVIVYIIYRPTMKSLKAKLQGLEKATPDQVKKEY